MKLQIALLFLLVASSSGCKHLRVADRWYDSDRVAEVPTEILPIWTDTVLHQPGKPGVRGFGGRVYFYTTGKPDPVPVDGQLVVYAFDGNTKDPEKVAPLRKYVITPDQLVSHHSSSSLGHSYSVWVPWDRVGGEGKALSLVVRFDGRNGGTTLSKPSRMLLPGVERLDEPLKLESSSAIQLASHETEETETPEAKKPGFETSSIDLPPSFQRRLLNSHRLDALATPSRESGSKQSVERLDGASRPDHGSSEFRNFANPNDSSNAMQSKPKGSTASTVPAITASAQSQEDVSPELDSAGVPNWGSSSNSHARPQRPIRSAQQRLQARRRLRARRVPVVADRQLHPEESPFALSIEAQNDS